MLQWQPLIQGVTDCIHLTDLSVFELSNLPKLRRIGLVRVSNITDEAIYTLANRHATLERIHLSYCDQISVMAIHFLLQKLHKLTHLSLTGIPAFRKPELQKFCRPPPSVCLFPRDTFNTFLYFFHKDFNMSQRATFCVYSGKGVSNLRTFLTELFDQMTEELNTTDETEYDDEYEDNYHEDVPDIDMETGEDEEEYLSGQVYHPSENVNVRTYRDHHAPVGPSTSQQPAPRRESPGPSSVTHNSLTENAEMQDVIMSSDVTAHPQAASVVPRRSRGLGQLPIVEASGSPPPSDGASIRSTGTNQSNGGAFFRTHQDIGSSHSNGALTPDLNFAEIGHGRGTGSSIPIQPLSRRAAESRPNFDTLVGSSSHGVPQPHEMPSENRHGPGFGYDFPPVFSKPIPIQREIASHAPPVMDAEAEDAARETPAEENADMDGRKNTKRGLRNPFAFATNSFSFGRTSNGRDGVIEEVDGMDSGHKS
jgi:F-box and leucine-rich repeat protein GRR1